MKKIFEKKIIIGSVFGLLTTGIATIALFFPSLFNLEKEKLGEPVAMTITSNNDLDKLFKVLSAKDFKKAQIFKLDTRFCRIDDIPYSVSNWSEDIFKQEDAALSILVNAARPSQENKHDYDEFPWQVIKLEGRVIREYIPPNNSPDCGEEESYTISGFFLPARQYSPHAGEEFIILRDVPEEQLKLRNY